MSKEKLEQIENRIEDLEKVEKELSTEQFEIEVQIKEILQKHFIYKGEKKIEFPMEITNPCKLHFVDSGSFLIEFSDDKFMEAALEFDYYDNTTEGINWSAFFSLLTMDDYFCLRCVPQELKDKLKEVRERRSKTHDEICKFEKWKENLKCAIKLEDVEIK